MAVLFIAGSVHGIAGLPTIFLPFLMQYRGRKLVFILSCILIIIGWTFAYAAQNVKTLIIGECFHGLGTNSLLAVSFLSVSEMVRPKYRNMCLVLYSTYQNLGISLVSILGRCMHWKTVGFVMGSPVLLSLVLGCVWPESPAWLAYKGKHKKCEQVFKQLRGMDEESKRELKALLSSKEEVEPTSRRTFKDLQKMATSRTFYLPTLHTFLLINVLYWGGGISVVVYGNDMILKTSGTNNGQIKLIMDISIFVGYNIAAVLVRYVSSKKVMLFSMSGSAIFMMLAGIVTYLQDLGSLSKDCEWASYCLVGFIAFFSLGAVGIGFSTASEIIPVKHRGIGGCLYVIFTCVLHSSSLKAYPYLCLYINIWGVFFIYAVYGLFSILCIWRYVPDTSNRTLKEIEDYYVCGYFKERNKDESVDVPFIK